MRIYRYATDDAPGRARVAVAGPTGRPVDLETAWELHHGPTAERPGFLHSTLALIESGPEAWVAVADAAAAADDSGAGWIGLHDSGAALLCPLDRLASLRDFLAFEDHVSRGAARRGTEVPAYWYEAPVYYKGNHRAIVHPGEPCPWPAYTERMDFELELAMVVGRGGSDIAASDAGAHVFGFMVFNDFSARDVQAREMSAWLGPAKGKDFANAFGPCIVTADEIGTEPDLEMTCRVNGEEWGTARSSAAHWRWSDMIAHVSAGEEIFPGDVYGSGTPGGCCGLDLGRELAPGDTVELEIEGIGVLTNPVGRRLSENSF